MIGKTKITILKIGDYGYSERLDRQWRYYETDMGKMIIWADPNPVGLFPLLSSYENNLPVDLIVGDSFDCVASSRERTLYGVELSIDDMQISELISISKSVNES